MTLPSSSHASAGDAHRNDPRFVDYYAKESATDRASARARGIMEAVMRARRQRGLRDNDLHVADVGCNAGTQSRCWLDAGHRVDGLDISQDLVAVARERNAEFGGRARFEVGTATRLPWPSASFDVCLLPELLEHVDDWRSCLEESVRVLRKGGTLYLSTTNVLCPVQQEFSLAGYSWYPAWLKRLIVARSSTTHRHWVNFASYPAVHWFSPYGLASFLRERGLETWDRFDLVDAESKGAFARAAISLIRALPPVRLLAHVASPSTTMLGFKP